MPAAYWPAGVGVVHPVEDVRVGHGQPRQVERESCREQQAGDERAAPAHRVTGAGNGRRDSARRRSRVRTIRQPCRARPAGDASDDDPGTAVQGGGNLGEPRAGAGQQHQQLDVEREVVDRRVREVERQEAAVEHLRSALRVGEWQSEQRPHQQREHAARRGPQPGATVDPRSRRPARGDRSVAVLRGIDQPQESRRAASPCRRPRSRRGRRPRARSRCVRRRPCRSAPARRSPERRMVGRDAARHPDGVVGRSVDHDDQLGVGAERTSRTRAASARAALPRYGRGRPATNA